MKKNIKKENSNLDLEKYLINKTLDNLENQNNQNNDGIEDFTIQATLNSRRRYISTKKSLLTVKKGYYIANHINGKIDSNKIADVIISSNISKDIKIKKNNIYKHYSLRNFLEDSLENKIVKNAKVNYNYTGDTTSEAAKMTVEKGYDASKASKAIVYKAKKVENLIRNGNIKDKSIKSYRVNSYSRAKNIKQQHRLAKNKYIKDLKRKELLKKTQQITKTSVNASKVAANSLYKSSAVLAKVIGTKLIIIGLILLLIFLSITQMMGGMFGTITSYKLISSDKKIIKNYQDFIKNLDEEFIEDISNISSKEGKHYDDVKIRIFSENEKIESNFKEFLVLNYVMNEQKLIFSENEKQQMREYYAMLNKVNKSIEYYHCDCRGSSKCGRRFHTRLYVDVTCLSMEDIIEIIDFTDFQKDWARELMLCDLEELYPGYNFEVEGGISGFSGLSQEEIANILVNMPETGVKREEILENAVSLVGKVPYFWGGKSQAGWNSLWNTPQKVTAPGTSDSGTIIPYGLDCSGFTDWAYKTSGINVLGGGGTAYQWNQSFGIDKKSAKPGDLVFKNPPNSNGINHVGIYIGKDKKTGKDQFVHCSYDKGVTIDSWSGFKYYRRVKIKLD